WELPGRIPRSDWISLRERLMKRRPDLRTVEFESNQMDALMMRCDRPPFADVRVRRALSLAMDRKALLDIIGEGLGAYNTAVPAGLKEWALPWTQLGAGTPYYSYDPPSARALLAEAGYRSGLRTTLDYCPWYGSDVVQVVVKNMKDV